jgi:hypothetical protein|nr:hypothetical protein [Kofleriaceae bacterium]
MMLGSLTFAILLWGSIAIGVVGALWLIARRDADRNRRAVPMPPGAVIPEAVIAGAGARSAARAWRAGAMRFAPLAMFVAGGAAAGWLYMKKVEVVIVRDGAGGLVTERAVYLGDMRGTCDRVLPGTTGGWVIDESSQDVRVESVDYGIAIGFGSKPDPIPAGKCRQTGDIDYVGPDNPPPSEVEVDSDFKMAFRTWLTWGGERSRR